MTPSLLITIGALFLAGMAADTLGRRTKVPRVTLLLICGVTIGHSGFDLLPSAVHGWYGPIADIALTMVAFLLGGALSLDHLRSRGRAILLVSAAVVVVTFALVGVGLWLLGAALPLALLLGAMATATDPAATQDAVAQTGRKGGFVDTLIGVVAIDDAWGMIVFSLAVALTGLLVGSGGATDIVLHALRDIGGALLLGLAIGLPAAQLTGRLKPGRPLQSEALGLVFLTAGLAQWLEVSFLMAGMTVGAIIVNTARHHDNAFHEIENVEWPFMILFFILAGASFDVASLMQIGAIGAGFIGLRIVARVIGGWLGAAMACSPAQERRWYGLALLPQAGVAVGMALVAAEAFPQWEATLLSLAVGSTVVFELLGPPLTALAVRRVPG